MERDTAEIDNNTAREETLDPHDWDEIRSLGHRMLDEMLDYLSALREKPVWQAVPESVEHNLKRPLPIEPQDAAAVYQEFVQNVLPYTNGNRHPRFWGWVQGNGTPLGMLADMLASGMNPHMAGFDQAPVLVENQVLAWLTELMGMPVETSGILTGGGTMANVTGLVVARHAKAGFDVREHGLQGGDHPKLMLYGSTETHGWAQKAAELMGLGNCARFAASPSTTTFEWTCQSFDELLMKTDKRDTDRSASLGTPVLLIPERLMTSAGSQGSAVRKTSGFTSTERSARSRR